MANEFLKATLYLPVSGDPLGFNHVMAAEWALRNAPDLERVVFILSNGHHPDPTKRGAHAPADQRLRIVETTVAEAADPSRSFLARRAVRAGDALRATPERLAVSTLELAHARAVPTAEAVDALKADAPGGGSARVNLYAGADLVRRMANPAVFSDTDVAALAASCRYFVLDRAGDSGQIALEQFRQARGRSLEARLLPAPSEQSDDMPEWLSAFVPLSSTLIRHTAEAGDPLEGMLTQGAAAIVREQNLYRAGTPPYHIVDAEGHAQGETTPLARLREALRDELSEAAARLAAALSARRERQQPATLSIVETACGGMLTWAFASRGGASRFFAQSRFAYDDRAKATLIGSDAPRSAVSAEMVTRLAEGMRLDAGTGYALAESGMAGPPDGQRHSLKQGECWLALATPEGTHTESLRLNPFLTRQEHQLQFAIHALRWTASVLRV
jgi:PncC family amidohydrolase